MIYASALLFSAFVHMLVVGSVVVRDAWGRFLMILVVISAVTCGSIAITLLFPGGVVP